MSKPIRVLVVDDHSIVREGICALLARRKDIQVIGEAADGKRALDAVAQFDPDVVLMDIQMPVLNGLEATREIHKRFPSTRILVLTQHDSKEYVVPLLRAGAVGYITKTARATELIGAIRAVYEEGAYLPPRITQTVVNAVAESAETKEAPPRLTERESQVVQLVAEGLSSREIAERLNISIKTVDTHRANMMEKLDVRNTAELIKLAIRKGIVSA
ncbi:MAG: response regulator transcription factor [Chloroflexi bacterium]|nr:response regulator transcription factor [Chloroflexota bacterium]